MSQGDQQILEPVDEVTDIEAIAYYRKMEVVMRRTIKKRKLMLDRKIFITINEMSFDIENANMIELIRAGMVTDATFDKEKMDAREVDAMNK